MRTTAGSGHSASAGEALAPLENRIRPLISDPRNVLRTVHLSESATAPAPSDGTRTRASMTPCAAPFILGRVPFWGEPGSGEGAASLQYCESEGLFSPAGTVSASRFSLGGSAQVENAVKTQGGL